jgi:hypothetical protein
MIIVEYPLRHYGRRRFSGISAEFDRIYAGGWLVLDSALPPAEDAAADPLRSSGRCNTMRMRR